MAVCCPSNTLAAPREHLTAIYRNKNLPGPSSKISAYGIFLVRLFVVFTRRSLKAEIIALKD